MRVVSQDGESKPESPLSLPARALLERALAEGAVTLLIAWETPTTFDRGTVPAADVIDEGFARRLMMDYLPQEIGE
jgi:hypothetical protein